jgi:hypothetical protein
MVDHNEMNKAFNKAINEVHNNFCNNCKADYDPNQGGYTDLFTVKKMYKIWYCDDCFEVIENEDEYFN